MAKPTSPVWTPGAPGTEGCIGYWLLHEGSGSTVTDISPNGNHGSFLGAPTWSSGPFGPQLSGFGSTVYGAAPLSAGSRPTGYPIWVAGFGINASTTKCVIGGYAHSTSGNVAGYPTYHEGSTGTLAWSHNGGSGSWAVPAWASGGVATDGEPHVLMGVSLSATDHRLYVDGVLRATSATATTWSADPDRVSIGLVWRGASNRQQYYQGGLIALAVGAGSVPDPAALAADWLSDTWTAAGGGAAPVSVSFPAALLMGF